ncbi:carbohydrate ABC transporter permease [Paenibacillus sp. YN15]|uniref:carbohydrate ABC transporter permease n=1 Tax=Paenibacillus sp. YN15 TaxID=1742774 RepID=UPI00215C4BA3|nr:sugar ABC transporter permease [Paenibacillus sp. YN15]
MQAMQQATSETGAPRPSKRRLFRQSQIYLMLLPNLILFTTLAVFPILWSLRYMFFDYDGIHQAVFTGLDNFVRIFTRDPIYWQSLWVTLVYAFGKLSLVLPLAFLVAVVLNASFKGSALLQAVIFSPTIMSASVMALIFYLLFNVYNGDVNHYLMTLGLIDQPIEWLGPKFAMLTVVIVAVWGGLGNYMVYFLAGLQTIPKDVYEAADLEGADYWQRLFKITLPMLGPVLRVILMLSIVTTFQDIQSIMVLTEGGPLGKTQVVFLYMYQLFFPVSTTSSIQPEIGYGAAASVVTGIILGFVTLLYLYISKKLEDVY